MTIRQKVFLLLLLFAYTPSIFAQSQAQNMHILANTKWFLTEDLTHSGWTIYTGPGFLTDVLDFGDTTLTSYSVGWKSKALHPYKQEEGKLRFKEKDGSLIDKNILSFSEEELILEQKFSGSLRYVPLQPVGKIGSVAEFETFLSSHVWIEKEPDPDHFDLNRSLFLAQNYKLSPDMEADYKIMVQAFFFETSFQFEREDSRAIINYGWQVTQVEDALFIRFTLIEDFPIQNQTFQVTRWEADFFEIAAGKDHIRRFERDKNY